MDEQNPITKRTRRMKGADELNVGSDDTGFEENSLESENEKLHETIARVMEENTRLAERMSRVEAVTSTAKLRKFDEQNDPTSLKKTGHVLSMDGTEPIIFMKRTGTAEQTGENEHVDQQIIHATLLSGKEVAFNLSSLVSRCAGNSIPCVVENYQEYREKEDEIMQKRHLFQRSNGKTARVDTVDLRKEIKRLEDEIRMTVTLSLDLGKTFTGPTVEIHPLSVFNAIA